MRHKLGVLLPSVIPPKWKCAIHPIVIYWQLAIFQIERRRVRLRGQDPPQTPPTFVKPDTEAASLTSHEARMSDSVGEPRNLSRILSCKVEPRARVELATCRLRIGCSTTELPRPLLITKDLLICRSLFLIDCHQFAINSYQNAFQPSPWPRANPSSPQCYTFRKWIPSDAPKSSSLSSEELRTG